MREWMCMRGKRIAALVGLVLGVILLSAVPASALCPDSCELTWSPVTQYTDNTAIEPADLPLTYIAEWDGVELPATTQTFIALPKPYGHGVAHSARVKSRTARGTEGPFSPPFPWNSPEGTPGVVLGIGVR
jgi:hypothetical protein